MGMEDAGITCGAVCVYPSRVAECVAFLNQYGAEQVYEHAECVINPELGASLFEIAQSLFALE